MDLTRTVLQLTAAAEPSRLRLLVTLLGGETSVGDLVAVLGQSQPRVSRHLRLLAEAGLVESFREGRSIFYRWSSGGLDSGIANSVSAVAASADPVIAQDRERFRALVRQRERDAIRRALRTGRARGMHAADGEIPVADVLKITPGAAGLGDVLHVGCGSGDLIRRLLPDVRAITGTEASGCGCQLARARLREAGLPRWTVRDADVSALPFGEAAFDLVILDDVLGAGGEVQSALEEANRVLRPRGRLLILDRILPTDGDLAGRLAALGFAITRRQWLPGRVPDRALFLASRPEPVAARSGTHD